MDKTILVVDDSGTVRQQVTLALKHGGFSTLEAANGRDGLAMVDSGRTIDLVISDVNMPEMNGLEMVEHIRSRHVNRTLPILMLTTEGQPSLMRRAKQAGAAGWMVKPFNASQLVMTVKHLTGA